MKIVDCRVQTIAESAQNLTILDPTKDQVYKKRKLEAQGKGTLSAPVSGSASAASVAVRDSDESVCPSSGWARYIPCDINFNDSHIQRYVVQCGKRASCMTAVSDAQQKTCIRPENRGHQFFKEEYLVDMWCQKNVNLMFFKSKCHPSQRKNDPLHCLWCSLDINFDVVKAYCSCKAGASGYCNHVMALLYQIREFSLNETKHIPEDLSRTSKPQVWHKPRIEGISAEPVMECVVGSKEKSNICEVRRTAAIENDGPLLQKVQEDLKQENPLYGIVYMASKDDENTVYVPTTLQFHVPKGSVLSYQLALTEGNFSAACNTASLEKF